MANPYAGPLLDFSPIGDLASTFFDSRDKARKAKLEDLELKAGDELAKLTLQSLNPGAPVAPSAPEPGMTPLSSLNPNGRLPTFAGGNDNMKMPTGTEFSQVGARLQADLMRDFNLSPEQAAGVVGNLAHESAGFRTLQEVKPLVPGSRGGFGYAQWTGPRRQAFEQWAAANKLDPTSYEANYGFLTHELKNTPEGRVLDSLRQAKDVGTATQVFSQQFLRPGIPGMDSRQKWAARAAGLTPQEAATASAADVPAPGARNAQGFAVPGQSQSAPVQAPPQIQIPAALQQALQHPNPYVRQKAAAMVMKYQEAQREFAIEQWKAQRDQANKDREFGYKDRELSQGEERISIDRNRAEWERSKPMTVSPEQDVIAPDGRVIRQGKQKPNVKTEVINGRVVFIDQDARTASDITPQGMPSGYRPMTAEEKAAFGIPENTGAMIGPDGKPASLPGTANTKIELPKAETKYDEGQGKNYSDLMSDMQKSARSAAGTKGTLRLMARLTEDENFYSGFGADKRLAANKFLASLGVKDPAAAAPNEVFTALVNDVVLGKLGGSLGPGVSNTDAQFIQQTAPNLTNTKEGNRFLIALTEKMMDRQQAVAKLARDYAKKSGGRIDLGFEDELAKWAESNPLLTEQDYQAAQAAMKGSPVGGSALPVRVSTPDEARKLPKGTKIILPDGSPGVVP